MRLNSTKRSRWAPSQPLCAGAWEEDWGSGVSPAAVCRRGVHGGWADWKAQPVHREHLARHQLCTRHTRRPVSTAQTHKHWRSKQRQTNTHHTGGGGGRGCVGAGWRVLWSLLLCCVQSASCILYLGTGKKGLCSRFWREIFKMIYFKKTIKKTHLIL